MIKKNYLVIAAAVLLLGAVAVKPTMAFLTDTHETSGVGTLHLNEGNITVIPHERIDKMTKLISVENTGELPVYVRVKVFGGRTHKLTLDTERSVGWREDSEGCYSYGELLPVGGKTGEVAVKIDDSKESADTFNVVVVAEATATLKADGTPDWDAKLPQQTSDDNGNNGNGDVPPNEATDNGQGGDQ